MVALASWWLQVKFIRGRRGRTCTALSAPVVVKLCSHGSGNCFSSSSYKPAALRQVERWLSAFGVSDMSMLISQPTVGRG